MKPVRWYFDFVSPYAYLQSRMLGDFEGKAAIEPVPVLFAGLLDHWGTTGPAELAPKRLWTYRFCQWFADAHGIPFAMPPAHPFNPLRPLRLAIAAGTDRGAIDAIYGFIWGQGRDPADPAEWAALVEAACVADADRRVADPAVKAQLRANTEAAARRGVFGVPTLEIDGELFWGVDGTDFARAVLDDPAILRAPAMARLADLPTGATRRPGPAGPAPS
jgi:2-hydroxychromene-2-carboxylate isomerase